MRVSIGSGDRALGRLLRAAEGAVRQALAEEHLQIISCDLREVHLDGEADARIGFSVLHANPDGDRRQEVLWAALVDGAPPRGSHEASSPTGALGVWRYPNDPELPGLARAVTPGARSGSRHPTPPGDLAPTAVVEVISLDPMRRAVVRHGPVGDAVYIRVLPPRRLPAVAAHHQCCADQGLPVPPVLGMVPHEGLLLTGELDGRPLRTHLERGGPPPDVAQLWSLVERLATVDDDYLGMAPPLLADLERWCHRLQRIGEPRRSRVARLTHRLEAFPVVAEAGTIHGDLHDGQVLVTSDGRITGIVDLDDLAVGDITDDLGRLIAMSMLRSASAPGAPVRVMPPPPDWFAALGQHLDPDQLRHRTATALVGLASRPWEARDPRSQRLLVRAFELAEHLAPRRAVRRRLADGLATHLGARTL